MRMYQNIQEESFENMNCVMSSIRNYMCFVLYALRAPDLDAYNYVRVYPYQERYDLWAPFHRKSV